MCEKLIYSEEEINERLTLLHRLWKLYGRPLSDGVMEMVTESLEYVPTRVLKAIIKNYRDTETYPPTIAQLIGLAEEAGVLKPRHKPKKSKKKKKTMSEEDYERILTYDLRDRGWEPNQVQEYIDDVYNDGKCAIWPDEIMNRFSKDIEDGYLEFCRRKAAAQ